MKKELALAVLTAIIATNIEVVDIHEFPEANLDTYVTGCQCRCPRPHWETVDMDS